MNKNSKIVFLTFIMCLLLVGITAVSAASDNTNTTISDTQTISDTGSVQSQAQDIATNTKVADTKTVKTTDKDTTKDIKKIDKKAVKKSVTATETVSVTPDTYSTTFTNDGTYSDKIYDLSGDFENIGDVNYTFNNVKFTSSNNNANFKNTTFTLTGSNIEISNINIANTNTTGTSAITIDQATDVVINNTNINYYKATGEVHGINILQSNTTTITNNYVNVTGEPQSMGWDNSSGAWAGAIKVSGIVIGNSPDAIVQYNTVYVQNSTVSTIGYSSSEGITVKAEGSKNVLVDRNNVTVTGAEYNYGTTTSATASNVTTSNNKFTIIGNMYGCGIQYDNIKSSLIEGNDIRLLITNTTSSENALAYGIIVTCWNKGNGDYNTISGNTINMTANIGYGMELYMTGYTNVTGNTIIGRGSKIMGIGAYQADYSNITSNTINLIQTSNSSNSIYEMIPPENAGIKYVDTSNSVISGNTIYMNELSDDSYAVTLDSSSSENIVQNNYFTVTSTNSKTGDNAVNNSDKTNEISNNSAASDISSLTAYRQVDEKIFHQPLSSFLKKIKKENNNIILNATTFDYYVTNNTFNDNVASGSTIDIQGKLDDPRFALTINKPVNIISSTHDAYISLDTTSSDFFGKNPGDCFIISREGSGTNITGITFYNTQIFVRNAENVTFDNITAINENQEIGGGVGVLCVRENSSYVTVKNSYFRTKDNGGHSTLVGAWVNHCTFDNNTIEGLGMCGNLVYLTTYNVDIPDLAHTNEYNRITNNKITGQNSQAICYGICVAGSNNLIENNTINYNGMGITTQWGSGTTDWTGTGIKTTDNTYNNNILNGGSFLVPTQSSVNNNTVSGAMTISSGSTINNNILNDVNILGNATLKNNKVSGTVTIRGSNVTLDDNTISTDNNYTITVNENLNNIIISNNHLASAIGRSDASIYNISSIILNNNNATSKNIYINDSNFNNYVYPHGTGYFLNLSNFVNNDVLYMNLTENVNNTNFRRMYFFNHEFLDRKYSLAYLNNVTLEIGHIYITKYMFMTGFGYLVNNTVKNVYIPSAFIASRLYNNLLYNYSFVNTTLEYTHTELDNGNQLDDNSFEVNGTLKSSIDTSINLTKNYNLNISTIIFDRPINLTANWNAEHYNQTVIFVSGSEGSNITGNVFDNKVVVNASSINFYNNTFNNGLEFNSVTGILLDSNNINSNNNSLILTEVTSSNIINNVFNGSNTPLVLNDSLRNNIVNNSIVTVDDSTVVLNENSANNNISNNYLAANNTAGDLSVAGESNIVNNNTPLDNVTVTINANSTMFTNNSYPVSITVTDNNRTVDNGYVTVYVYGIPQGNYTLVNGTANTNVTLNDTGNIRIKAWYYPTTKYNIGNNKLIVNAIKVGTRININNITARYGDNVIITGTVTDENNNNINTGVINITAGDETETVNITNGTFTLNTTVAESWYNKNITAYYDGNEVYANTTTSITPALTKGDTVISFNNTVNSNNDISLTATLTNQNGALITSGQIVFRDANGRLIDMASVTNGSYTINYTPQSDDDVTITVTYRGNNYYNEKAANATIILVRNTTTSVSPVTGFVGNNITITASVNSSEAVNEGIVVFTTGNGTVLGSSNVTNGTATITVVFNNAVNDTVIVVYNGTNRFNTSNTKNNLNINKINTYIIIDPISGVLGRNISIIAHVTDMNGKAVNNGFVVFKVNGVTLKDANNTAIHVDVVNGRAVLNTTGTWINARNVSASYSGTDYVYNQARTDNGTINLANQNATVNMTINRNLKPGSRLVAVVHITDANGNLVNAGKVVFKLNSKTLKINGTTAQYNVTNGIVTLNYIIPEDYSAKTYRLSAIFGGNIYNRAETRQNFTLSKLNATVKLNIVSKNIKPGQRLIAAANITDTNGNPVTRGKAIFKINGKTLKDTRGNTITVKVVNGQAVLNYTIPTTFSGKTYNLTVQFGGSNYNNVKTSTNLTINKINTRIQNATATINGNTLRVRANIINNDTNKVANQRPTKVTVKIDKKTVIKQRIVNNGIININTTVSTKKGQHTVEIITGENGLYKSSRQTVTAVKRA